MTNNKINIWYKLRIIKSRVNKNWIMKLKLNKNLRIMKLNFNKN